MLIITARILQSISKRFEPSESKRYIFFLTRIFCDSNHHFTVFYLRGNETLLYRIMAFQNPILT